MGEAEQLTCGTPSKGVSCGLTTGGVSPAFLSEATTEDGSSTEYNCKNYLADSSLKKRTADDHPMRQQFSGEKLDMCNVRQTSSSVSSVGVLRHQRRGGRFGSSKQSDLQPEPQRPGFGACKTVGRSDDNCEDDDFNDVEADGGHLAGSQLATACQDANRCPSSFSAETGLTSINPLPSSVGSCTWQEGVQLPEGRVVVPSLEKVSAIPCTLGEPPREGSCDSSDSKQRLTCDAETRTTAQRSCNAHAAVTSTGAPSFVVPGRRPPVRATEDAAAAGTWDSGEPTSFLTAEGIGGAPPGGEGLGVLMRRALVGDLHVLLALPLSLCIAFVLLVEALLYLLVRLAGRFVEKAIHSRFARQCLRELKRAESYEAYSNIAQVVDTATGREAWKYTCEPDSRVAQFDPGLLERKILELREARSRRDFHSALCSVKSCVDSHLGFGTLHPSLYSMTFTGTKQLAAQMLDELVLTIEFLQQQSSSSCLSEETYAALAQLYTDFGGTGLCLSGGAMFGLHHMGVLAALLEINALPNVISGASAGSAVAALVGCMTHEELRRFVNDSTKINVLASPFYPRNWAERLWHLLRKGHAVDASGALGFVVGVYGTSTFLEAYRRTGRVLNVTVTRSAAAADVVILNYRVSPHVIIGTAVMASTSFPYLGKPVHLLEKDEATGKIYRSRQFSGRFFRDGSLRGDIPSALLGTAWNCKYTVVSQVNPHVFPFLGLRSHGTPGAPVRGWSSYTVWRGGFPLAAFEVALKEHLRFLLRVLSLLEIVPTINGLNLNHVMLQSYSGDLDLYPARVYAPHIFFLGNIPQTFQSWYVHIGKQMVYPRAPLLCARMRVEKALERLYVSCLSAHGSHANLDRRIPTTPLASTLPLAVLLRSRQKQILGTQKLASEDADNAEENSVPRCRRAKSTTRINQLLALSLSFGTSSDGENAAGPVGIHELRRERSAPGLDRSSRQKSLTL